MQAQRLETTDIFKSAVFLCNGGRLAGVRFKERKRGIISFLIEGDGILQVDLDYRNGQAQVNALELRQTLNHLRDVLFTRLREQSPASSHDYAEARGRKHGNRASGHRSSQTY